VQVTKKKGEADGKTGSWRVGTGMEIDLLVGMGGEGGLNPDSSLKKGGRHAGGYRGRGLACFFLELMSTYKGSTWRAALMREGFGGTRVFVGRGDGASVTGLLQQRGGTNGSVLRIVWHERRDHMRGSIVNHQTFICSAGLCIGKGKKGKKVQNIFGKDSKSLHRVKKSNGTGTRNKHLQHEW